MYDFAKFSDADLKECGANVTAPGGDASSMEDAATKIVNYLSDNITDSSGNRANALVRLYKTTLTINWTRACKDSPRASWCLRPVMTPIV